MSLPKKVTVILTSFNHAKYLREAIDSVLDQTFAGFELVILDDGSTDESWEIISSYKDPRIKAFKSLPNNLVSNVRTAIEAARTEYIAIHHSDDVWELNKLEKQVAFLDDHPEIGAVFSRAQIIDENGNPFQDPHHYYARAFEQPNRTRHEWLNFFFYHGNALCHPSLLIRRACYTECGLYRYGLAQLPDFDMWVRLCLKYEIHILPERLVRFRIRANEANTSGNRPEARIRWHFEFLRVLENYKLLPTMHELIKVFPAAGKFDLREGADLEFALGMLALESKSNQLTGLFGLNILYDLLQDSARLQRVQALYGFKPTDLFELTGQYDVFQAEVVRTLQGQVREQLARLAEQTRELTEIKSGTKWKLFQLILKTRLFLFPIGGRREKFIRSILQGIQAVRTSGFRAVIIKLVRRIRAAIRQPQVIVVPVAPDTTSLYVPPRTEAPAPEALHAKLIAFYLPQFHPIPENDVWWGKGFTEWTNVSKARPNFEGHYQPQLPGELGYYDLRLTEVQERQVALAKQYGIHGFCFYYYWFAGKRLLERPIDQYLDNPHLDLPFCLCWANENWTRRWDGAEHEILIAQEYTEEQYLHFIQDISKHFSDPRYIRVEGKPLLLVYRVNLLPDAQQAVEIWRRECERMGFGGVYLVAVQSFGITDPTPYGFDAAVEFPPSGLVEAEVSLKSVKITNPNFRGRVFDYRLAMQAMLQKPHGNYPFFKSVMPAWDNTARRQNEGHIFINSSPAAYKEWLSKVVNQTKTRLPMEKRMIFVNAWNEWAEGTRLEPDQRYGYAYLQATYEALTLNQQPNWTILFVSHNAHAGGSQTVLLNTIAWFKAHTQLELKILCMEGGELLPHFQQLAETIVLNDAFMKGKTDQDILNELLLQLKGARPDLIYGNTVVAGKLYPILKQMNAPIITHVHEMETSIQHYASETMDSVIKLSDFYLACSGATRNNLIDRYKIPAEKIAIGHASIYADTNLSILTASEKQKRRKKLGLLQDKFIIFGCGIGMPFRKGADLFIELGRLLLKNGRSNFHMYWIGNFDRTASDENLGVWADYVGQIKREHLQNQITFMGYKENPREYFQAGDIHIMTSREEPFGLVALEAADAGLPTICFESAGAADFVEQDAGFTIPHQDLNEFTRKIIQLMDNPDLKAALGQQAKKKLLRSYTVEQTTPHILSACRAVANKKPVVSVIVPNYNHAPYLPERLESIFNQSFKDFEVILLDDASTDNSLEILGEFSQHADVKLIRNHQNSGSPFIQWLNGLDQARGDIWWIAESDDVSDPDFLKNLLPAFENPRTHIAYANSSIIDEKSKVVGDYLDSEYLAAVSKTKWRQNYRVSAQQEINDSLGVKDTILNISAVLFRKFAIKDVLRNNLQQFRLAGDWFFLVNAIKGGDVHYDARKLNYHRRHKESVIGKLLASNRVETFYREIGNIHRTVVMEYQLSAGFHEKWEQYLREQWRQFFGDRPFEDLQAYYPYAEISHAIKDQKELS